MPTPVPLAGYSRSKGSRRSPGSAPSRRPPSPGLSVEECVRRLKRFHYAFKRLHEILTARLTAEPIYELKTAFAHHAYLCAEHVTALRTRVGEMREPPLGLEDVPHPALEVSSTRSSARPDDGGAGLGRVRRHPHRPPGRPPAVPEGDQPADRRPEPAGAEIRPDGSRGDELVGGPGAAVPGRRRPGPRRP